MCENEIELFFKSIPSDLEFNKNAPNLYRYSLFLKDYRDFYFYLCFLIKRYSTEYADFLEKYYDYFISKNMLLMFTRESISYHKSFLKTLVTMIHESYHVINTKKIHEDFSFSVPPEIQKKIAELDAKNIQIVKELEQRGMGQEAIRRKIIELETEDSINFPEILKYDSIELTSGILYFTNISGKEFSIPLRPSLPFSEYVSNLPDEIKLNMCTFDAYLNPITKTNSTASDFYSYLDEFVAEFQSIKSAVELYPLCVALNRKNDKNKYFEFDKNLKKQLNDDFSCVTFYITIFAEYFYVIASYMYFVKAKDSEFYLIVQSDEILKSLFKTIQAELIDIREKYNHMCLKYNFKLNLSNNSIFIKEINKKEFAEELRKLNFDVSIITNCLEGE